MKAIRYTPAAIEDFEGIWRYTAEKWGEDQAVNYLNALRNRLRMLSEFPEMGRDRSSIRSGYRSITHQRHVIFYKITAVRIEVVRILHHRMNIET